MKSKEALKTLRVTRQTLYRYVKEGKIRVVTMPNGRYEYNDQDIFAAIGKNVDRKTVIYARVSTAKQKSDLARQIQCLEDYALSNSYIVGEKYVDVISGMRMDRNGLNKLIQDVMEYKVERILITYKDRLARLSYDLLEKLFAQYGTVIVPVNETENEKGLEHELVSELITMIHSFSMKMYSSRRKAKLKRIAEELKDAEENIDPE